METSAHYSLPGFKFSTLSSFSTFSSIVLKRDGRLVEYDQSRIYEALEKCFSSVGKEPKTPLRDLVLRVENILIGRSYDVPTVEHIQDAVENVLFGAGEYEAAKAYILYRAERAKARETRPVPEDVKNAYDQSSLYFPTTLQQFQFFDKYSRFDHEIGRRETWVETVGRSVDFMKELVYQHGQSLPEDVWQKIYKFIAEMKAMPSMRLLAMAGPAARRQNASIYNCTYLPVESVDAFVETLLLSMSGCGVGFSVERQYVEQFPRIKRVGNSQPIFYPVEDSTEGWCEALRFGLETWFDGGDVRFDFSQIRPAGAVLYTKGGRASGPEPLRYLLDFARHKIQARQGRYLRPIDAHDIMCAVGNAAVSGGVRRTAMISLFDLDDDEMRLSKSGDFERDNSQRWNANNSAVWTDTQSMSQEQFSQFFLDMVHSNRGEPGIFSREAANALMPDRRSRDYVMGTNPCGEVILRPWEMCNLSITVARADDNIISLREKVEVATIIGTIQSLATNFPGLRPMWKQNCEEERLLGVDITGQLDCSAVQNEYTMRSLRGTVIETNKKYAELLNINQSAATTVVKPSGNSSQLLNTSSGLHARWAPYYIRNVRVSATSPVFKALRDAGVPMDPENGQTPEDANTWVIHFPVKSPDGAVTRNNRSAIEQCDYWLLNKLNWTEHNPSVTITYRPEEIIDLLSWVWEHRTEVGGMAFLPAFDAQYAQLPYIEITKEEYEKLLEKFPSIIDFSRIYHYEESDKTTAAQELACSSGYCSIDDLPGS